MKPALGVCYYPEHWPEDMWQRDAARMAETGITWVRIGEFAWSRLEIAEGNFNWDWLDRAVAILASHNLKIIMGTPSATPPHWVLRKYPDMLACGRDGQPRGFGSRRHYCFSHLGYRAEAARMAGMMAQRYGKNPAIAAWQIDNEYGCHDTALSYSDAALHGFREWLARKYQSPDALNRAWGNVFWSMDYDDFDAVELPNRTVTEANPSHRLDFARYTSAQVVAFNRAQADAIRAHSDRPLVHNYMGRVLSFDHFAVAADLDIAAWDSYPLGFLEAALTDDDSHKAHFARQGDPDFQAFHHDLYRAVGRGNLWIMEQQPGPVNWAPYNPAPLDGMVKLWGMEAIAHGASLVSYFRWRQAPFAQEQMHAGLLRADDADAPARAEVKSLANEIDSLGAMETTAADVAIVFDYESAWAGAIQPQGKGYDYFASVFAQYRALRGFGLSVDFLPGDTESFGAYKMILIPGLMAWNDNLRGAIKNATAVILAGPRTGLKTHAMHIARPLGPDFAGAKSARVATLRPNMGLAVAGGGQAMHWIEEIEAEKIFLQSKDGAPLVAQKDNHFYLAAMLDAAGYQNLLGTLCKKAGIAIEVMPHGVRKRVHGGRSFIFNYNAEAAEYNGKTIPAAGYIRE